jgi:hypothetical protein
MPAHLQHLTKLPVSDPNQYFQISSHMTYVSKYQDNSYSLFAVPAGERHKEIDLPYFHI